MPTLEFVKTMPGDTNFHLFESLISLVYPPEIEKLKPLESITHSLLESAYVILKDGKPASRCCLYYNPELRFKDRKACCLGNFESINDVACVDELFRVVTVDAKTKGFEYILGPMNGSTWESYRLGIPSNTPNFFLEPYTQSYYADLFTGSGFETIARYVSNMDKEQDLNDERIKEAESRFIQQGITFRNIDLQQYEAELSSLHGFCMESFKHNFLFTAISKDAFIEKYMKVKPYIDPQDVIIAENPAKEIVGFIFCLENFHDTVKKGMIIKTIAKHNSICYGGMGNVLASRFKRKALENGYQYIIHAFMIESNASNCLSQHFSGELLRAYFLYGKEIH
jgi:hypothetical protein